ncbi:MAG TPA: glycosyltransferase family 2 protein [Verrucomicrobiae bacterium]|nr:glycosyltransferase family 2 protein [Verrucomicrobiae bacterium]
MSKPKLISVIVPGHNEAKNIPLLYEELRQVAAGLSYEFEFIFVDDGSKDESPIIVRRLRKQDPRVRLIEFVRNFGKEAATSAGIHAAKGDAAIIMDADLQHPPSLLPEFIKHWENGGEVIVGVRTYSDGESAFKKLTSRLYYSIMQRVSHTHITPHATDFRLLDRAVVDEFNILTERNRMTRGLIDWLGFKREYVHFEAPERQHGEAAYTLKKLITLAINSFTSYSMLPLRLAGYIGAFILAVATPIGLFILIEKYLLQDPWNLNFSGPAILAFILLILVGIILVCLGLVALYIANIHSEVLNRPLYVVRRETEPVVQSETE